MPAGADEVIKARLAAVRPVLGMMTIDELRTVAARETAAAIVALRRPAERRWGHAGLAAHVQRFAVATLEYPDQGRIAPDPVRSKSTAPDPPRQVDPKDPPARARAGPSPEHGSSVDSDLPLKPVLGLRCHRQEAFGQQPEGIRLPGGQGRPGLQRRRSHPRQFRGIVLGRRMAGGMLSAAADSAGFPAPPKLRVRRAVDPPGNEVSHPSSSGSACWPSEQSHASCSRGRCRLVTQNEGRRAIASACFNSVLLRERSSLRPACASPPAQLTIAPQDLPLLRARTRSHRLLSVCTRTAQGSIQLRTSFSAPKTRL